MAGDFLVEEEDIGARPLIFAEPSDGKKIDSVLMEEKRKQEERKKYGKKRNELKKKKTESGLLHLHKK